MSISDTRQALDHRGLWRFGREVRTLRLHDPIGFRIRGVGEYLLLDKAPAPALRY
ncbi:MAG: hypothetical protein AB7S51_11410 [Porticoccaceae bacterium]